MADEPHFRPPNRGALWASLRLTRRQVAQLTGLTERQVGHWLAQGYLPRSVRAPDHLGGDAVDMAVLIRHGLDQGLPLRQAARAALEAARASGAGDSLEGIERILREGGGAARRRAAHRRGGVPAMLDQLVEETAGG